MHTKNRELIHRRDELLRERANIEAGEIGKREAQRLSRIQGEVRAISRSLKTRTGGLRCRKLGAEMRS